MPTSRFFLSIRAGLYHSTPLQRITKNLRHNLAQKMPRTPDIPPRTNTARDFEISIRNRPFIPLAHSSSFQYPLVKNRLHTTVSQNLDPSEQSNLRETQGINLSDDRYNKRGTYDQDFVFPEIHL